MAGPPVIDTFASSQPATPVAEKNPIHRLSGEKNGSTAGDAGERPRVERIDRPHHQQAASGQLFPGAIRQVPAIGRQRDGAARIDRFNASEDGNAIAKRDGSAGARVAGRSSIHDAHPASATPPRPPAPQSPAAPRGATVPARPRCPRLVSSARRRFRGAHRRCRAAAVSDPSRDSGAAADGCPPVSPRARRSSPARARESPRSCRRPSRRRSASRPVSIS